MTEFREDSGPGRVLVTDGEFKHTLGIVRSLAARGHEVHLLARSGRAPAAHSLAVTRWYPAPASGASGFEPRLAHLLDTLKPLSLVPVGSGAMGAVHRMRDSLPSSVAVALPPSSAYETANEKARTAVAARTIGLATPNELLVANLDQARRAFGALGSPMVLKSAREEGVKALRYVRTDAGLEPAYQAVRSLASGAMLAQECVSGDGYGFSALYWHGHRVRHCMHRRVREWPPSGGTSACAESLPECPELERAGTALLDALQWHGVAMVEFKGEPTREGLKLMEINAKFWGSHDLALAAGVDFPGDLVALLEGGSLPPQPPVKRVRFSWPLGGDLWHGLYRPASLPRVLWDAISPGTAHNFRLADPAPHLWELIQWARSTPGAWREQEDLK